MTLTFAQQLQLFTAADVEAAVAEAVATPPSREVWCGDCIELMHWSYRRRKWECGRCGA